MTYRIDQQTWATPYAANHIRTDLGVVIEAADLIDSKGNRWTEGAHRVKVNGRVVKTFKGETAWMDAERLAGDEITKIIYS